MRTFHSFRIPTRRSAFLHPLLSALCLFLTPFFSSLTATAAQPALPPSAPVFGQEKSDLRADPAARFGKLPTGMRYVILPNAEPKNRASLRLLVVAGSLQEFDSQRGLAHFLEHLAFNGSTHYAPGTLVEFFQRMGMNFGGDTNASTSFDRTVYMLELPDTKPATLAEGLTVFSDYAGGLLLNQTEIDKERGIILSEKRARDSVDYRQFVAEFNFLLGNTRPPQRLPIGETAVIEKAGREHFVDFYDTWYRPERMALVAVGDFDAAALEKLLTEKLSPLAARAPARPDPALGDIKPFEGIRAFHHYEAEAASTAVSIQTLVPFPDEPDTAATRLAQLPRDMAVAMLNRRLAILAKEENSAFTQGYAAVADGFRLYRNATIELTCKPEQWAAALATAEQELRRALQHGFTASELREAAANTLNALEQAVKTAPTRRSESLAGEILGALVSGDVFTTPADELALYKPALASLTPEACADALRAAWSATGRYVTVIGNAKVSESQTGPITPGEKKRTAQIRDMVAKETGNPPVVLSDDEETKRIEAIRAEAGRARAKHAITAAYEKSAATPVAPPAKTDDAAFAYTDFGPAGKIAARKHVDDLDLDLVTFANGVRLNFKKTDFEAGKIRISLRIGDGELALPRDKPGLATFIGATFTAGGLGKHSADDLKRILAGRTVGSGFRIGDDALQFSASTNRDDLLLQLQLIAAFITDPGYRPESVRQAQKYFEQAYTRLAHTPQGPLQLEVPRLLAGGDNRFGFPLQAELSARTLDEARAWLAPQFAKGAIEIAIAGDIDPGATLDAVAATLGALPDRSAKPALDAERLVKIPAPVASTYTVDTEIPKGVLALFWPTTDARDVRVTRRLGMLASVFNDRLRVQVREKLGDAYSPSAGSDCSDTYRDYGFIYTYVVLDPAKAALLDETVSAIAADLAQNGVTDDELERAKKPVLTALRESARTNGYWLQAVLSNAQEFPQRLDWCRTRYTDNESITKVDLDALAKTYLAPARAFRATVLPK